MNLNNIYVALLNNQSVYWKNKAYKVILSNHALFVIYEYNDYMTQLSTSDIQDCFIA